MSMRQCTPGTEASWDKEKTDWCCNAVCLGRGCKCAVLSRNAFEAAG